MSDPHALDPRTKLPELLQRGYIPVSDPVGDQVARAAWDARFDELAATPPSHDEMVDRIRAILAEPRPHPTCWDPWPRVEPPPAIVGGDPDTGKGRAWIRPQDLIVTPHSDFPYHSTVERLAELSIETAQDRDRAERLSRDLHVVQVSRPGGSAFWVDQNGNHRALSFRALGLPVVPAQLRPQGSWWEVTRKHGYRGALSLGWPP